MAKTLTFEVTVPEGLTAGDTFTVKVEQPEKVKRGRGILHGIAIEDMTDEQLKREIINANSVLYKAKLRGAKAEIIEANEARAAAAKAERDKRVGTIVKGVAVAEEDYAESDESVGETVYNEEV